MARGTVVIDTNRCKGCELCTTVCPQHVLVMADFYNARGYRPAQLVDPDSKCTGCTPVSYTHLDVYKRQTLMTS